MEKSDNRFQVMINAIPTMAWGALPDGSVEFLNQRWHDYTGLSIEEAAGWGWTVTIHPDDLRKLTDTWQRVLASGQAGQEEARVRRFDGEYRWFLFRTVPMRDGQEKVVRWYGTNTDIEDLKNAEEKLRQAGDLRTVIDTIPTMAWSALPDGCVDFLSRSWLDYTGLSTVQALDWGWKVAIHPDDLSGILEIFGRAVKSGQPFEADSRFRRSDGEFRWFLFRARPLRDDSGEVVKWYGTNTDLEDRKRAELALLKAFEEIKSLKDQLSGENLALKEEIDRSLMFEEIVGSSPALQTVLSSVLKVAPTDSTVLITGETGTGKELIARAIHKRSQRSNQAFISVNCASIPPTLIASELFGHEKGAFTGALQQRQGRFELARSGTLFLDEIGELPAETQIALLRVLQERQFERVGGSRVIRADVRLITATNRNLPTAIKDGFFRADLFYRLNVFPIEMPPLRQRKDDIPMLVEYFVKRYAEKAGKQIRKIDKHTMEICETYHWPGNIRELQNIIERSVILCGSHTLSVDKAWFSIQTPPASPKSGDLTETLLHQEKEFIEVALAESKGRVAGPDGAAAKLGVPASTLDSKIKQFKINKHKFFTAAS
jgi:formate hydrogenlyase transcriptional activator